MVRDVDGRAAELFMEWTNAYAIDVAELKEQIEEFRDTYEAQIKYTRRQRLFGTR